MRKNVSRFVKEMTLTDPDRRRQNPLLPVTVQDQIRLWELEKNRLKSQEGTCTVLTCTLVIVTEIATLDRS